MHVQTRKLMLASGLALALAASAAAADPVRQDVTDARQESQIWTTYALSPHLRANDLQVSVHAGKVTLTGKVDEAVRKELAGEIALGVSGIKSVDNQIVVEPGHTPATRSVDRGYGDVIDDATITATVKSKLLWSSNARGLATNVETRWGKVTLKGTADTVAARTLAGRLALNTRGVVSVDNQLTIAAAPPAATDAARTAAGEAGDDVADSWITTKVKSTFMYSTNVDGSDIGVSTTGGVVTLRGKVDSAAERALAIELATHIRGVKSVNSSALTL